MFVLEIHFSDGSQKLLIFGVFNFYYFTYMELNDVSKTLCMLELKLCIVFWRHIRICKINLKDDFFRGILSRSFEKQIMGRFFSQGDLECLYLVRQLSISTFQLFSSLRVSFVLPQ